MAIHALDLINRALERGIGFTVRLSLIRQDV